MNKSHLKTGQAIILFLGVFLTACAAEGAVRLSTLYAFETNGNFPSGPLVQSKGGDYYGLANVGGKYSEGTVFKIDPHGFLTTVFSFDITNGAGPSGGLVLSTNGFFYGTTQMGGTSGYGTIFKFRPGDKLVPLFSFAGTNGGSPNGLIEGNDGNFYGTTAYGGETSAEPGGGISGYGTVFRMNSNGVVTTLAVFHGTNGAMNYSPFAQHLAQDSSGNLYGTTISGGNGYGTAFKVTPEGALMTLVTFDILNGMPNGLLLAKDGNLYGTSYYGGAYNSGTVFRISMDGTLSTVYSFNGLDNVEHNFDGANPFSELTQNRDGSLCGSTLYGGQNIFSFGQYGGVGTIFKITTNGVFTPLCSFGTYTNFYNTGPCFANPLVQDKKGNFYGTSLRGGILSTGGGYGSFFKLSIIRPILAVTQPHQHDRVIEPAVTVTGKTKAKLNTPITEVFYQINDGDFTGASTTNGWTNWTVTVTLKSGSNIFRAYAVDATASVSRTNVLKLDLLH